MSTKMSNIKQSNRLNLEQARVYRRNPFAFIRVHDMAAHMAILELREQTGTIVQGMRQLIRLIDSRAEAFEYNPGSSIN